MLSKVKNSLYLVFGYLGVEIEAFAILLLFMCLDSVLGAVTAVRLNEKFRFKKMLWGFTLKLCFLIVPLVIALLGKSLGYDFHSVVNVTISVLTVAESYSIIGNIYAAKNKVRVEKMDAVSTLLSSLRKMIKGLLGGLIDKIEK